MKFKKPYWAIQQITRETGLVEDVCEHGIGHPNQIWLKKFGRECDGIHGCDGCCCKIKLLKKN